MKQLTMVLIVLLMFSCGQAKKETDQAALAEQMQKQEQAEREAKITAYLEKLKTPLAEPLEAEEAIGVIYSNDLRGGWQLLGRDNELLPFVQSRAFIFIEYYKSYDYYIAKGSLHKLPPHDDNTCFVVMYYWNPKIRVWTTEYNGGQQEGDTIHVAPLEGELSKGKPYDIIHIIEPDGRRYIEIKNHETLRLDGRRFVKVMP